MVMELIRGSPPKARGFFKYNPNYSILFKAEAGRALRLLRN